MKMAADLTTCLIGEEGSLRSPAGAPRLVSFAQAGPAPLPPTPPLCLAPAAGFKGRVCEGSGRGQTEPSSPFGAIKARTPPVVLFEPPPTHWSLSFLVFDRSALPVFSLIHFIYSTNSLHIVFFEFP